MEYEGEGGKKRREMAVGESGQGESEDTNCLVSSLFRIMSFQPSGSADNSLTSRGNQMVQISQETRVKTGHRPGQRADVFTILHNMLIC